MSDEERRARERLVLRSGDPVKELRMLVDRARAGEGVEEPTSVARVLECVESLTREGRLVAKFALGLTDPSSLFGVRRMAYWVRLPQGQRLLRLALRRTGDRNTIDVSSLVGRALVAKVERVTWHGKTIPRIIARAEGGP